MAWSSRDTLDVMFLEKRGETADAKERSVYVERKREKEREKEKKGTADLSRSTFRSNAMILERREKERDKKEKEEKEEKEERKKRLKEKIERKE